MGTMNRENPKAMNDDSVRVDKWLWAARFFKTRTMATDAVDGGKVKLNGERIKPARGVKLGDRLDIDNGATEWEVVVEGLSDVRRGAPQAQALYRETEESVKRREEAAEQRRYFREPGEAIRGRPTKRDRRVLSRSQG
jgi:ribosome-associated heat shock protein Hsp15